MTEISEGVKMKNRPRGHHEDGIMRIRGTTSVDARARPLVVPCFGGRPASLLAAPRGRALSRQLRSEFAARHRVLPAQGPSLAGAWR